VRVAVSLRIPLTPVSTRRSTGIALSRGRLLWQLAHDARIQNKIFQWSHPPVRAATADIHRGSLCEPGIFVNQHLWSAEHELHTSDGNGDVTVDVAGAAILVTDSFSAIVTTAQWRAGQHTRADPRGVSSLSTA